MAFKRFPHGVVLSMPGFDVLRPCLWPIPIRQFAKASLAQLHGEGQHTMGKVTECGNQFRVDFLDKVFPRKSVS